MGDLQPLFKENPKPKIPDGESYIPVQRVCPRCQQVNPNRLTRFCSECEPIEKAEEDAKDAIRLAQTRNSLIWEWLTPSGIPPRYHLSNFQAFNRDLQPVAFDTAKTYAETKLIGTDWATEEGKEDYEYTYPSEYKAPSLMLSSRGNGTGKTHLAVAVAGRFMRECANAWDWDDGKERCPVLFTTIPKMLLRIRATYRDDAAESETDVINDLATVRLLVLDDVGKEKPSEHTRQTYFTVIDSRYGANLPIVITSNLTLPKQLKELNNIMGEASMSRLKEMTEGWRVVMDGEDYRFHENKP